MQKTLNEVVLIAADAKYYEPLKVTILSVKKFFPNIKIIVYDLGLKEFMIEKVN
jgi:hypothetical protein